MRGVNTYWGRIWNDSVAGGDVMAVWLGHPCSRYNVFTPCMFLLELDVYGQWVISRGWSSGRTSYVSYRQVHWSSATAAWCYQRQTAPCRRSVGRRDWVSEPVPGGRCRCLSHKQMGFVLMALSGPELVKIIDTINCLYVYAMCLYTHLSLHCNLAMYIQSRLSTV